MNASKVMKLLTMKDMDQKEEGILEGFANVYTMDGEPYIDRTGDTLKPGALEGAAEVPVLVGHDPDKPVGIATLEERSYGNKYGIWATIQLAINAKSPELRNRAQEAFELVKNGIMKKMSIGFRILNYSYQKIKNQSVRVIDKIDLMEVSLTPIPANAESSVLMAKNATIAQEKVIPKIPSFQIVGNVDGVTIKQEEVVKGLAELLRNPKAAPYLEAISDQFEAKTGARRWNMEFIWYDTYSRKMFLEALEQIQDPWVGAYIKRSIEDIYYNSPGKSYTA